MGTLLASTEFLMRHLQPKPLFGARTSSWVFWDALPDGRSLLEKPAARPSSAARGSRPVPDVTLNFAQFHPIGTSPLFKLSRRFQIWVLGPILLVIAPSCVSHKFESMSSSKKKKKLMAMKLIQGPVACPRNLSL